MFMEKKKITYDDRIARQFIFASVIFGIVGMLVGALVALQLAFHEANAAPILTFGRLRPLHTNAVIFAFVGNMMFAGVYYSSQRLLKVSMPFPKLAQVHFWGWQLIILAAAITLPLGFTSGKEYAELEWPIDIAIAVVWVIFAINFFAMLAKRNERHLYVAIWFYIATIVTVAVLHIVNSLAIPVDGLKSYSLFGGVQDALVQWWYGHNAVAFFLTTPILGIMYYYLPKAAERPVYSYRLSIIHFWSLVFLYIWAGPHHLLNTAMPDWAQTLGMVFSLMLWAPSWGGMINGLLTLRGAWDKLRRDPVLKFFAAAVTFYGMSTFEGPLLSIKAVSGLAHYTDWIIGHVHAGGLGWNGFMAAGMFYFLVPRLYGTQLKSVGQANLHFYMATVGIILYVVSMWVAGVTQGLMWQAENADGGLMYPNFIETLLALDILYWTRLFGGLLYLAGFVIMAVNLVRTAMSGKAVNGEAEVTVTRPETPKKSLGAILTGKPVVLTAIVTGIVAVAGLTNPLASFSMLLVGLLLGAVLVLFSDSMRPAGSPSWHSILEGRALPFTVLTVVAILVGGFAEIVPTLVAGAKVERGGVVQPYTPLELEGRDVYLAEGCYTCHSQMIRPFVWETARYGEVSTVEESALDHPFQWGSRRIGPDLARVGGKYPAAWHYEHMLDPRATSPGSIMPAYPHLVERTIDFDDTDSKMRAQMMAGVPYKPLEIQSSAQDAASQAQEIVDELKKEAGVEIAPNTELVALIAYMQRLGRPPVEPAPDPATAEAADAATGETEETAADAAAEAK